MERVHATQLIRGGARIQARPVCAELLCLLGAVESRAKLPVLQRTVGTGVTRLRRASMGGCRCLAGTPVYLLDPSLRIQSSLKRACSGKQLFLRQFSFGPNVFVKLS